MSIPWAPRAELKSCRRWGVQGKEGAPGEASPFRGRGGDSRWFFPFTCLKIKNSSPDVSCASGPICLDNRVSSRSVEINKHRETTSKDRRRARGWAGGGEPPTQPPQSTSASRRCCAPGPRTGRPPALPSQTLFLTPCSPPRPATLTLSGGTKSSFLCPRLHSRCHRHAANHAGCVWRGNGPTGTPSARV